MRAEEETHLRHYYADDSGNVIARVRMFRFSEPVADERFWRAVSDCGVPRRGDPHPDFDTQEVEETIRVVDALEGPVVGARVIYRRGLKR